MADVMRFLGFISVKRGLRDGLLEVMNSGTMWVAWGYSVLVG
jgi:hypothetical protein